MNAIEECIRLAENYHLAERYRWLPGDDTPAAARAELAQLHATIALNKYITPPFDLTDDATVQLALECAAKDRRIAALEAAVNEAREVISNYRALPLGPAGYCSRPLADLHDAAWTWLAAHPAPAAAEEQTSNKNTCLCLIAEKPVRPCSQHCWHFAAGNSAPPCVNCNNTGVQIAALVAAKEQAA